MKKLIEYMEEFDNGFERTGIPKAFTPALRKAIEGWEQSLVDEICETLYKSFDDDNAGDMEFSVFCIKQCVVYEESIFEIEDMTDKICTGCEYAKEHLVCSNKNSHYRKAMKIAGSVSFNMMDTFDMQKLESIIVGIGR